MAQVGARNPGRQIQNRILNYDDNKDLKFYKAATEKLEEVYDGNNLPTFLKTLSAKAKQFHWSDLLSVEVGNPPMRKSILTQYGEISREQVQQKALTYLGNGTRQDQNSDMIFNCLRKSVSKEVLDIVYTEPDRYSFTVLNEPEPLEDGLCFLKAIIDHTYTSTLANVGKARENLISLKEYMEALPDSNITEFNIYVKKQVATLAAGGFTTNELVTNLFKGYAHAKDKDFREWIKTKKRAYFEKTLTIHPNCMDFMKLAEDYYKDAVTAGEWLQPDDDQRTILALEAKINKLNSFHPQKRDPNARKRNAKDEWAWKNIPPKDGEPKKKKFKGKTYYWCKNHKQWTIHSPSECRLKQSGDAKPQHKSLKDKKALKLKVYQAALQTSSEDEGSDNEDQDSHSMSSKESVDSNTSA
jgi:hypothetical protein